MRYPREICCWDVLAENTDLQVVRKGGSEPLVVILRHGVVQGLRDALATGQNYDADYAYTAADMQFLGKVQEDLKNGVSL